MLDKLAPIRKKLWRITCGKWSYPERKQYSRVGHSSARMKTNESAILPQEKGSVEPQASPTLITFAVVALMSASTTLSIASGDYTALKPETVETEEQTQESVSPPTDAPQPKAAIAPPEPVQPAPAPPEASQPQKINQPQKITDADELIFLEGQLFDTIDQTWEFPVTETSVYVVRVDETGAVVAYTPTNSIAQDNVENTPLPELVESDRLAELEKGGGKFAEFEVIFDRTGILEVQPDNNFDENGNQ